MKIILLLLMNALFAATFPLGKDALAYSTPVFLTGIRMLMAGILFLGYAAYTRQLPERLSARQMGFFIKTAFFYVILAFVPEFWALTYLSSIKTNLLWSAQPFLAALLGYIFFAEKLTPQKGIALIIGLLGLLPIMLAGEHSFSFAELGSVSYPELALFIAIFSTLYGWVLIKHLMQQGYTLSCINGITMSLGGLGCLLISMGETSVSGQVMYSDMGMVLWYSLLLVLASNIIGYSLYGYFLSHYSITFLSFSGFTCPLFGFIFSYFKGEPIYMSYIYGCGLIILGLYLFYQQEFKVRNTSQP